MLSEFIEVAEASQTVGKDYYECLKCRADDVL